jgi:hypothetical protein
MEFDIIGLIERVGVPVAILIYVLRDMRGDMKELTGSVKEMSGIIISHFGTGKSSAGD